MDGDAVASPSFSTPAARGPSAWPIARWIPRRKPRQSAPAALEACAVSAETEAIATAVEADEIMEADLLEDQDALEFAEDDEWHVERDPSECSTFQESEAGLQDDDEPDELARLQAIIAGLPHQTVPERGTLAAKKAGKLMSRPHSRRTFDDSCVARSANVADLRATNTSSSSNAALPPAVPALPASVGHSKTQHRRDDGSLPPPESSTSCPATELRLQERAEAALARACLEYPDFAQLKSLTVVHASLDFLCLADHGSEKLFVAARGTDKDMRRATLPRDLGNDALIFFGFGPTRVKRVAMEYHSVCERLPGYTAYGTGHSLGASVIEWLAVWAESAPERHTFQRVDLFNPGSSLLRRLRGRRGGPAPLVHTQVRAHHVVGDVVSQFHKCAGPRHTHPRQPRLSAHSLVHFLPQADDAAKAARVAVAGATNVAIARVVAAQAAARTAVAAVAARAVANVLRAMEKVALAEAAAAADERGHLPFKQRVSLLRRQPRQSEPAAANGWVRGCPTSEPGIACRPVIGEDVAASDAGTESGSRESAADVQSNSSVGSSVAASAAVAPQRGRLGRLMPAFVRPRVGARAAPLEAPSAQLHEDRVATAAPSSFGEVSSSAGSPSGLPPAVGQTKQRFAFFRRKQPGGATVAAQSTSDVALEETVEPQGVQTTPLASPGTYVAPSAIESVVITGATVDRSRALVAC